MPADNGQLVLSLFPGIGLFDRAFRAEGFCVVCGPDLLWGADVREFHPPRGCAAGIIGGPPCQDFSSLRRAAPTGNGLAMLAEYCRIVEAVGPEWFLCENVARVPDIAIEGYVVQRLDINQGWYSGTSRLRHVQFGSRSGKRLHIPPGRAVRGAEPAAVASDARSLSELCRLQGLPPDFALPGFTIEAAKRAVGNGVPIVMGRVLAQAIKAAYDPSFQRQALLFEGAAERRACACGCGRRLKDSQTYYGPACRKRAQRRRERSKSEAAARDPSMSHAATGPTSAA